MTACDPLLFDKALLFFGRKSGDEMGLLPKVAALAAMLTCIGAAEAQGPRTVELSPEAAFKHRHSKVQFPPALAGTQRTKAVEYEADQLDTASEYATADQGEVYTFYIYRNVTGALPVWFDRARRMIERRAELGTVSVHTARQFIPPGRATASGLIATYAASGKSYRSSGVALVPVGEWLIKLRASSRTLAPADLEVRMMATLAEIAWPKKMAPAPAVVPVAPCVTALPLSGDAMPPEKNEDRSAESLMGALIGMTASQVPTKRTAQSPTPRWCRDSIELPDAGVYRANEQSDGYLLALSDAGRGVLVGRSAGYLLDERSDKAPRPAKYEVQVILLSKILTSGLLDRLPPPSQARAIADKGPFASSFGTWGKGKGKVSISSDALQ